MIINVGDLNRGSRELRFDLDSGEVRRAIGDRPDIGIVHAEADLTAEVVEKTVHLRGSVVLKGRAMCDRCADEFEFGVKMPVKLVLMPDDDGRKKFGDEDIGFGYYREEKVDLREQAIEIVSFLFPDLLLCDPECKGICLGCRVNLNTETCRCGAPESGAKPVNR